MVAEKVFVKFKGTLALTVAFVGLVLYYFYVEIPTEKKQKEEKALSEKVLSIQPEDVDEISIIRKNQTIVVRRNGAEPWEIIQPVRAKAEHLAIATFLEKLLNTKYSRVVEENPADLSVFGLKDPSAQISLKTKSAGNVTVSVGDKSPIGQTTYLKRDDQHRILLVPSSPKDWEATLFDLRDKAIFTYKTQEVLELEIIRADASLRMVKKEDVWEVEGVGKSRGDAKDIEDLLNTLRAGMVSAFIEEAPKDLGSFGLDAQTIKVTVKMGDGKTAQSLWIGAKTSAGKFYAKTGQSENVFSVDSNLVAALSKGELDLLDKGLFVFNAEDIIELKMRNGDDEILLHRESGDAKWKAVQPPDMAIDSSAVNALLQGLKEARASKYVSRKGNVALYGLDAPQKKIALVTKEKKNMGVMIGRQSDDKTLYYATREGEETVFTLQADTVSRISASASDLKDKRLLKLNADDAVKITIQYPDKTFDLNRQDKEWSLSLPKPIKKIKPFIGKDILWTLSNLEFDDLASTVEKADYGFDHPKAKITIADKQNKVVASLLVGNQVGSQHYAQMVGATAVYLIKDRFMSEIPSELKRFEE